MDGTLFILESSIVHLDEKLVGDSVVTVPGSEVQVDVSIVNDFPIGEFTIPFNWSGDLSLTFDSVSTFGLRTDYFQGKQWVVYDPANQRCAYKITSSTDGSIPELEPGSGPILSLHFTVPASAYGEPNPIVFSGTDNVPPQVVTDCFTYEPQVQDGYIALFESPVYGHVNLASASNVEDDTVLIPEQTHAFTIRVTNVGSGKDYNIANGFRVYSPDGATWATTIGSWLNDFDVQFSSVFTNYFGVTGMDADTVGFAGIAMALGTGLVDGWDTESLEITIGPVSADDAGKHVCIDSCWFPPSTTTWRWDGLNGTGTDYPSWSGDTCFVVGEGCCVGLSGNVDDDPEDMCDLSDLTKLIDYLFISFIAPECIEEANIDGDAKGLVDLGDLTALIDYLFITFTPPAECL